MPVKGLFVRTEIPKLDPVPHTMLMTFAARAASSEVAPDTNFEDPWGAMLLKKLSWDLTSYQLDPCFVRHVALRAKRMDRLTAEFFQKNAGAMGIGLGCGLCTRGRRIRGILNGNTHGVSIIRWVDIDLPEVIDIRRQYLPPFPKETLMACSITDISWIDRLSRPNGRPLFLVMEGVSPYLSFAQNRSLFHDLGSRLEGTGTEMVFDYIHPALVDSKYVSNQAAGTSTPFQSGFCNAEAVKDLHPSIQVVSEYSTFSEISPRHHLFEMEFEAASLGQKPYTILHIRFGRRG